MMNPKTRKLANMAMLVAISVILVTFIHFPLFPAAPFLEYDPADIPIFIGTFAFGPGAGLMLTAVVCVIQGATVSAGTGGVIGAVMHFFATGAFVLVAGLIYKKHKSKKMAVIALGCGILAMTISMVIWNILFTPIFMGAPREAVMAMILPIIVPFNMIKAGANSIVTFLLYKSIAKYLHK